MISALVNGAHQETSRTHRVSDILLGMLSHHGPVERIDVLDHDPGSLLPGRQTPEQDNLREKLSNSQVIYIVSPIYHGGCSGLTKLYLDSLPRAIFQGKAVGLIGVSGSDRQGPALWHSLAPVAASLGATHVSRGIEISAKDWSSDTELTTQLNERLTREIDRLNHLGSAIASLHTSSV